MFWGFVWDIFDIGTFLDFTNSVWSINKWVSMKKWASIQIFSFLSSILLWNIVILKNKLIIDSHFSPKRKNLLFCSSSIVIPNALNFFLSLRELQCLRIITLVEKLWITSIILYWPNWSFTVSSRKLKNIQVDLNDLILLQCIPILNIPFKSFALVDLFPTECFKVLNPESHLAEFLDFVFYLTEPDL